MTKMDTMQTLAILGGVGAAFSPLSVPFISIWSSPLYWLYSFYFFYGFGIVIVTLLLLTGIIALILALRATSYISKMPQRAASNLKGVGVLVIIVGIISLVNLLAIISGIVILVAGVECNTIWKRIQRARTQTGWPYVTVATAAGSSWARRTSCRFCGAPLVLLKASAHRHLVRVDTRCPLDETTDTVQLPLSQLESWTPVIANRLHRCEKCGDRTAALIVVNQTRMTTRLQAYCPHGHNNRTYRRVWTPLYPHVARTPRAAVGFQRKPIPSQVQPVFRDSPPRKATHPISISSSTTTSTGYQAIGFCTQCGVKVEPVDIYCFRCGHKIR